MIDDLELEARLRRYRPAAPPGSLRDRVLSKSEPVLRQSFHLWWQLAAAAVLLAVGSGFQTATARIDRRLASGPLNDQTRHLTATDEFEVLIHEAELIGQPSPDETFEWPESELFQ